MRRRISHTRFHSRSIPTANQQENRKDFKQASTGSRTGPLEETDKKVSKYQPPRSSIFVSLIKLPLYRNLFQRKFNLTPGAIASRNSALTLDTFSNIYQLPNSRNKNKQQRSNPSLCPDLSKTMRYDDRSGASRTYNSDFTNDQSKQRMDAFKHDRFSVMGQDMDMQSVQQHIYPQGSTFEYIQPAQIYIATIVDMFFQP